MLYLDGNGDVRLNERKNGFESTLLKQRNASGGFMRGATNLFFVSFGEFTVEVRAESVNADR